MKMSVGGMLGDKHMKIKVIVLILSCMLILSICIWFIFGLSSSRREFIVIRSKLIFSEIITYFRPVVHLDYYPEDTIIEVQMAGKISMLSWDTIEYGNIAYNKKASIDQISNYLNTLILAEAKEEERSNESPDVFIHYLNDNGKITQSFIIYGQTFIRDVENKKLYRIKKSKTGIIEGLEKIHFTENEKAEQE